MMTNDKPEVNYFDLAPSQIAEWYAHKLDPKSSLYNISFNHYFFKNIYIDFFIEAWNIILSKHDCFQLRFLNTEMGPKQFVGKVITIDKDSVYIDMTDLPEEQVFSKQDEFAEYYAKEPFDFDNNNLFRLHLIEYPDDEFQLIFTIHHIIWDELSTINLLTDFAEIYNAISENREYKLPNLDMSFADYAKEESKFISDGKYEHHKQYWISLFDEVPPHLQLPIDYTRPHIQTYNGNTCSVWLPKATIREVKAFLVQHHYSLFVYFMSVLGLFFHRITEQDTFSLGYPLSGREPKHRGLYGCFAIPIAIKYDFSKLDIFYDLLEDVKTQFTSALEHYHYPCHKIIEHHRHAKDLSRPKLFSVMAGVQNEKPELMSLELSSAELYTKDVYSAETHGARFDLAIGLDPIGSDIKLFCSYNTDLFHMNTIKEFFSSIEILFKDCHKNIDMQLKAIPIMSTEKTNYIINTLSGTKPKQFQYNNIISYIINFAKNHSEAIAVLTEDRQYTYTELLYRVLLFSQYLVDLKLGTNAKIAVLFEPKFELIVVLLGIIHLGGCYIPLSINSPLSRNKEILDQLQVDKIVTTKDFLTLIPDSYGNKLIYLSNIPVKDDGLFNNVKPPLNTDKNSLMYIMFTSGSTGKPKPIPIKYSAVHDLLLIMQERYQLNTNDRVLFSTPLVFDPSVLEVFWPLLFGAKIVISDNSKVKNSEKLLDFILSRKISILQSTPVMLSALVNDYKRYYSGIKNDIRIIISGASPLTRTLRDDIINTFQAPLFNHYGPTESTVDALVFDCHHEFRGDTAPLGKPLPDVRVFILDAQDQQVPIGIIGHIVIASSRLTDGYLYNDELTNKSFFKSNLNNYLQEEIRMYRTGDLGKFNHDGQVYFLGRIDNQVKVNGIRIELEEIESKLEEHIAVSKAAALLLQSKNHNDFLKAYVELNLSAINIFNSKDEFYSQYTLSQIPSLEQRMNAIHYTTWPKYFNGSPALKKYWPNLYLNFPEYQFGLLNSEGELACVANGIPFYWDNTLSLADLTWDGCFALANKQHDRCIKPNAILGLSGIVLHNFQGKGLSNCIVQGFRALAKMHKLNYFLGPVRPVGMLENMEYDVFKWSDLLDENNEPKDFWLRTHLRLGAKKIGTNNRSQLVTGSIQDWEEWLGENILEPNGYRHSTMLQEFIYDNNTGIACYYDPAIWVLHSNLQSETSISECISENTLKDYLTLRLPAYMCPQQIEILAKMPITESNKVDKQLLTIANHSSEIIIKPAKTTLEKKLVEFWQDLLDVKQIGINQDFFMLGGQSLQAVKLCLHLEKNYNIIITLKEFYLNPTILKLAKLIEAQLAAGEPICQV